MATSRFERRRPADDSACCRINSCLEVARSGFDFVELFRIREMLKTRVNGAMR